MCDLRAAVGDAVAAEVEEDEAAGLEVARVVADLEVADGVVAEPEAGEARAVAEADGEAVRVVADAGREVEGAEGGGGGEVRGEAQHAVLRDIVLGEVEVLQRVEGVEALGERVEVGAAAQTTS